MSHFYPLLARAVADLADGTGELRRTLYERAQASLMAELAAANPPPSADDIDREYRALASAIRRVEAETTRANGEMSALKLSYSKDFVLKVLARRATGSADSKVVYNVSDLIDLLPI
jgi:hypothetical protein